MVVDDFNKTVDDVSQSTPQRDSEMAETFYEKREYKNVDPGQYRAMIVKSELKESKSEFDEPGTTKINLRWEIMADIMGTPITYVGDDGKDHRYQVFGKPLAKNYGNGKGKSGKPSNLFTLVMELTGIPPLTTEKDSERHLADGRTVKGRLITFDYKMLELMECQITVKHKEYQGKMYPYIDSYFCTPQMRKKNYDLLPPHEKKVLYPAPAMPQGTQTQAPAPQVNVAEAAGEVFVADKAQEAPKRDEAAWRAEKLREAGAAATAIPPIRTPEEEAKLKQEARDSGFPID